MKNRGLGLFYVDILYIVAPFLFRFRSIAWDLDFFPFNRRIIYDIISGDNILDGSHNSPFQSSPDKVRVGQETTLSGNIPIGL